MALDPYRNQTAYQGADTRDLGLPSVNGVIDLRDTVDKIARAATPSIDKKNKENAERDVLQAIGKNEKGEFVRPAMSRKHGSDYEAVFEKAAGDLQKLDVLSRTEQSFNEMMADEALRNDPVAMASAMNAYREGVLETVGPDVAVEVDTLVRREASQRLLTTANRVQSEERQATAQGVWNKFKATQQAIIKLQSLPGADTDQSALDQLSILKGRQDMLAGSLVKMKEASPEYFEGEDMQVETALIDVERERASSRYMAKNGWDLLKLENQQLETFLQVTGPGALDVDPSLVFELPGGLKSTVADLQRLDPQVVAGMRSRVAQTLNKRDDDARKLAAAKAAAEKDAQDIADAQAGEAYVLAGGKMTNEQRIAANKSFMVAGGILSPDGMVASPEQTNAFFNKGGGQALAIQHFEKYREMPEPAVAWMKGAFSGGNYKTGMAFINNAREARDIRTGARTGDLIFDGLPKQVTNMFYAGSTMIRGGYTDAQINMVMGRLADDDFIAPDTAAKKIGPTFQADSEKLLRKSYGSIDITRLPKAMLDDYRDMLNLTAYAGQNMANGLVLEDAITHLKTAWTLDPKFVGGAGPTKFVAKGYTDRELQRAVTDYRKSRGLAPLQSVADFTKGTLQLRPIRTADPRANFGVWEAVLVEPRTGRDMGSFRIDMDYVNQRITRDRTTLAPNRAAIIQTETRARRATRNRSQQNYARQTRNDRPGQ